MIDKKILHLKSKVIKNYKSSKNYIPKNINKINDSIDVIVDINYLSNYNDGLLDLYYPKDNKESLPLIVWIHGGAYIAGDKDRSKAYCKTLASMGFIVANINYLLVPEGRYPLPIIQTYEALNYLKCHRDEYKIDFNNVFIGGDSAGAQIASQIGAIESNPILAKKMNISDFFTDNLRGLILCCGLYNMNTVLDSGFPAIKLYMNLYTDSDFEFYSRKLELSTVENITKYYPNTFITCGKKDYFINQTKELIINLKRNNINYTFVEGKGGHECQFGLRKKEALITFNELVNFIHENII